MHLGRHLSRSVDSVGSCPNVPILKTPRIVCGYECGMEYKGLTRVCHTSKSVQALTHVMSLIISDNRTLGSDYASHSTPPRPCTFRLVGSVRTHVLQAGPCGCLRIAFSILPMLRYTGHVCLSPLNLESWVLSDERMTGAIVAPGRSLSWVESDAVHCVILLLSSIPECSTTSRTSTFRYIFCSSSVRLRTSSVVRKPVYLKRLNLR